MAMVVSMGMPTSQGSQYFSVCLGRGMSQGCTNTAAPSSAHASNTGKNLGSLSCSFWMLEPISMPAMPGSCMARRNSATAASGCDMGRVARARNLPGWSAQTCESSSLMRAERSAASSRLSQ